MDLKLHCVCRDMSCYGSGTSNAQFRAKIEERIVVGGLKVERLEKAEVVR